MIHRMQSKRATGHGKWLECALCGAAKHNGLWWLGGYKSEQEPPCTSIGLDENWKTSAIKLELNDLEQ